MQRPNLHATAIVTGSQGILIFGPSGAGKSSLAFQLIDSARAQGRFACFVSDDRVWLSVHNNKLIAEAPETIKGLAEVHFYGPTPVFHQSRAVIDRVVVLADATSAPRYREDTKEIIEGIALPALTLPTRNAAGGARAIMAWLNEPFASTMLSS